MTLAAVAGVALTQSLGFWQLSRAAQREALQAGIDAKKGLPALNNAELATMKGITNEINRPVRLLGRWLARHTVYLDNRQMQGRQGFYVMTPLQLEGMASAVLVQRGWVPRNFVERTRLSPVDTPEGLVEIAGRLAPPPARLYEFGGDAVAESRSSVIRQNLDLAAFGKETRLALESFTVLQVGPASQGLLRDWPEVASGTGKHYGYAFQWFGLSGLMAILYVWFQFIAPWRARRS